MWFLFGEVSSSSGGLGWATLFNCGTPCTFHIIILVVSHLGFEDGNFVFVAPVPGHRFPFTLCHPDLEENSHPTIL